MEAKKGRTIYDNFRRVTGFSIIELLLGIFLSSIILLIMVGTLVSQDKVFYTQADMSRAQQNMRIAMKKVSKDLMMAGAGKPSWTTINGHSDLDFSVRYSGGALDVVGCLDAPRGHLAGSASADATTITLKTGEGSNFNTTTRSDIRIGDGENAQVVGVSGDTLTIDTNPLLSGNQGLSYSYNGNAEICLLKWITYSVDTSDPGNPVLKADEHQGAGAQAIAEYITDMGITISGNVVDVTLTGRTKNPSKTTGQYITTEMANKIFLRNAI